MHHSGLHTPNNMSTSKQHCSGSPPEEWKFLLESCCWELQHWDPCGQYFPNVLCGIKVRRHHWPFYLLDNVIRQENCNDSNSVWMRVFIREKGSVTYKVSQQKHNGLENIFPIIMQVHVALDHVQISSFSYGNSGPHHYGPTSPPVNSNCKLRVVTLSYTSPHT